MVQVFFSEKREKLIVWENTRFDSDAHLELPENHCRQRY
jgi:hypothetical protein